MQKRQIALLLEVQVHPYLLVLETVYFEETQHQLSDIFVVDLDDVVHVDVVHVDVVHVAFVVVVVIVALVILELETEAEIEIDVDVHVDVHVDVVMVVDLDLLMYVVYWHLMVELKDFQLQIIQL